MSMKLPLMTLLSNTTQISPAAIQAELKGGTMMGLIRRSVKDVTDHPSTGCPSVVAREKKFSYSFEATMEGLLDWNCSGNGLLSSPAMVITHPRPAPARLPASKYRQTGVRITQEENPYSVLPSARQQSNPANSTTLVGSEYPMLKISSYSTGQAKKTLSSSSLPRNI
ncbi:uncharacterized protein CIMG_05281 [Coccidioides immitis RS]|uniref:Uncharacterized protein n=3 Tax=Coccidioides TaxID=5500 RepID=J3KF81_COCIM|nr:uncharacterized protein CIMG_05281 [Coccidioides immitis RS]EAS34257.3 hypothetical protein CIMG_05281 [Coccidioides immitis RS]EFW17591.1 conserved hypothetical protein [Coccidioides posadasii str. Silveira]KMM70767.1 hypothetical protein CPAG_07078 [Coccidioides posadasii RMSCC 3488]